MRFKAFQISGYNFYCGLSKSVLKCTSDLSERKEVKILQKFPTRKIRLRTALPDDFREIKSRTPKKIVVYVHCTINSPKMPFLYQNQVFFRELPLCFLPKIDFLWTVVQNHEKL